MKIQIGEISSNKKGTETLERDQKGDLDDRKRKENLRGVKERGKGSEVGGEEF